MLLDSITMDATTAFWGMTINNYDETDLALVQQGYPDHVRQIVYTLERGEETGTPHIQAYLRLFRQQRLSYVKKLFPRGSFKALHADEYKLNAQRYAQKLDATAESSAVITNNPFPDPVVELTDVIRAVRQTWLDQSVPWYNTKEKDIMYYIQQEQNHRVAEKPSLAKFYVSATYKAVKKDYWRSLCHFLDAEDDPSKNETHTHTHTQRKIIFSTGDITDDAPQDGSSTGSGGAQEEACEDYSDGDCSDDEAQSEGECSECSEEDDCSEC